MIKDKDDKRARKLILKLERHNESKEIEFELNYLKSLTTRQRFEMMFSKRQEMLRLLGNAARPKDLEDLKYLLRLKRDS